MHTCNWFINCLIEYLITLTDLFNLADYFGRSHTWEHVSKHSYCNIYVNGIYKFNRYVRWIQYIDIIGRYEVVMTVR